MLKKLSPLKVHVIIGLLSFLITILFFKSGAQTNDIIYQLGEARKFNQGLQLDDLHPPVLTYLLSLFDDNYSSEDKDKEYDPTLAFKKKSSFVENSWRPLASMFFFQIIMYWIALILFARVFFQDKIILGSLMIVATGFSFPIFAYLAVLTKDISFMSSLLLGLGLIVLGYKRSKNWIIFASLPFIFYALNVRHNALPAMLPISFLFIFSLTASYKNSLKVLLFRSIGAISLVAAMMAGGHFFSYVILKASKSHISQVLLLYDLVGISVRENVDLIPPDFKGSEAIDIEGLRNIYSEENVFWLFALKDTKVLLKFTKDHKVFNDLSMHWWSSIKTYPVSYAKHRLRVTEYLFGLPGSGVCYPVAKANGLLERNYEAYKKHSIYYPFISLDRLRAVSQSFLFRGWYYFLGNFLGMCLCIILLLTTKVKALLKMRERLSQTTIYTLLVLFSSGWLYSLPYLVVSLGCDYRYHYWSVTSFYTGLFLALFTMFKKSNFIKSKVA